MAPTETLWEGFKNLKQLWEGEGKSMPTIIKEKQPRQVKEMSAGTGQAATSLSCQDTVQGQVSTSKLRRQKNNVRMNQAVWQADHRRVTRETRNTNSAISTAGRAPAPLTSRKKLSLPGKRNQKQKNHRSLLPSPLIRHSGKQIGDLELWITDGSWGHCFVMKWLCSEGSLVTDRVSLFVAVTKKLGAKPLASGVQH